MRDWAALAIVAALFVGFCLAFSFETPYRTPGVLLHQKNVDRTPRQIQDLGAPDERQHANYVASLLEGKGIPVLRPGDPNLYESYQAHQPPLYYVLATGWCKVFGIDPTSPTQGSALRLLNVLIGLATMVGLYYGAKWGFGDDAPAWAAAAFVLMPMSVALHSAVTNDPLLYALCTWVMAFLGRVVTRGWTLKLAVAVGVLTGLAIVTKTTSIALLPCVLIALVMTRKDPERKASVKAILACVLVPLVFAVPWWTRNTMLYGDPLAVKAFETAFTGSPQTATFIEAFGPFTYWFSMVLWWTARSAIGAFGYMDVFLFEEMGNAKSASIYTALVFLLLIPAVLGVVARCVKPAKTSADPRAVTVWTVFGVTVLLLFVRFNLQYFQGQARYLYPGIGPIAWCWAAGLAWIVRKRPAVVGLVATLVFVALDLISLRTIAMGFAVRV